MRIKRRQSIISVFPRHDINTYVVSKGVTSSGVTAVLKILHGSFYHECHELTNNTNSSVPIRGIRLFVPIRD
jgi:hypothetical protein